MKTFIANLSLMRKLSLIMAIAAIALIAETAIFLSATSMIDKSFTTFETESFDGVKTVLETEKELNYFSRVTREIMLGGDLEENLEKLSSTHTNIETLFHHMEATLSTPEQKKLYKQAMQDATVFLNSSHDLMNTLRDGKHDLRKTYHVYHKEFSPLAKASRHSMDKLVESKMAEEKHMRQTFKEDLTSWGFIALAAGIVGMAIMITVMLMIVSQIRGSVESIRRGLQGFFAFLGGDRDRSEPISALGHDEFGEMGSMINDNIVRLETKTAEQRRAIGEFESVCSDAGKGFLYHRVNTRYADPALSQLTGTLNTLLDKTEETFASLIQQLIYCAQGNYSAVSNTHSDSKGSFASVEQSLSALTTSMSEVFALIARFSNEFTQNANLLAASGDSLSASANQQASSLEETAAAIEELTSNVASNTSKAEEMARAAREAKNAAETGNAVANNSLEAMNEIVTATEAIHQAVEIIDNIAFQTNILSLNAAVEAATAGDAGKGFAVVAQEVRNLANRSAEAAAQIQDLARTAREKSRGGLETSKNMMESFTTISEKISQTDNMVRDVANASREQMAGISQINDAVAQLDQMTQQNAKTANNVASVANEILAKTEQFEQMISRITFDQSTAAKACDVGLIFDTTKLKIDHINFKENNYKRLKNEAVSWKVTNHHECALGQWIDAHASSAFAQTPQWQMLLQHHEQVHKGVQEYIDTDLSDVTGQSVEDIAALIEHSVRGVFDGLDAVKANNCEKSYEF